MRICLMVSGGLGFEVLKNIFNASTDEVIAVFTNKSSTPIIDFCIQQNIPFFDKNPRGGSATTFVSTISCEVLLSVNYLFVIEEDIISLPSKLAVNIHGSLLPKYRGRTPHVWSIINNEETTGITAHLIEPTVDSGDILKQISVPINPEDTGADMLKRYNQLYPQLINEVLDQIRHDKVSLTPQNEEEATYFGKRTPEDGQINWSWSKERIKNWIRAQARPYPGAFTFYSGQRITIHQASFSTFGFHASMPNGTILKIENDSLTIKTATGALQISGLEYSGTVNFKTGNTFK